MYTIFTQAVKQSRLPPKTIADILVNKKWDKHPPKTGRELVKILSDKSKSIIDDQERILNLAKTVITDNPNAVKDIKSGKTQAVFFLIGEMKKKLENIDVNKAKQAIDNLLKP
jgi:Asp-tRNA(Asn)/Glu-tRNA(Gln) amidotransferase B subunit